ncbi:putative manganese transporter [Spartinivicinus poritis]|uniref:Manganese transporter n=1 Tax=Spartinivicinus poritis TaxID=2994640 RepID=A0ABT5UGI5_9GAMM|nr:putative manganese transporter [Spartinivicinus sp. A2-2]MDE1464548.1 putative manganese transporter [Spartinivicinus sp. A2-2]
MFIQRQQGLRVSLAQQGWQLTNKRLLLPTVLFALLLTDNTRELTIGVLADAFWQVAAYVAATLALFHYLTERFDKSGFFQEKLAGSNTLQVLFAAFMGALPGCGGAIVVVTQYVKGNLSFGGVVAVLTATMGDAAFLLLASKPADGLFIIALGFGVGLVSGLLVDKIHGVDFMRPKLKQQSAQINCDKPNPCNRNIIKLQGKFWQWMLLPAMTFAVMGSFQVDTDQLFGFAEGTSAGLGAAAAMIAIVLWATTREVTSYESAVAEDPKANNVALFQRVAQDTNFVTSWVIAAFLMFELVVYWFDINLAALFSDWAPLMPLMGVLIGLLPGCGPQILVTSLYIGGAVPMSAQLGNAISNDGDALFPAIALAPKAAVMATLYSTIPALVAAYGYFVIFE